jgi:hypothetical protein
LTAAVNLPKNAPGLRDFTELVDNLPATETVNNPARQIENEEHPPIDTPEGDEIPADGAFSEESHK